MRVEKTGPAYGKIEIGGLVVILNDAGKVVREEDLADMYLHVRGYARAPENHIDVEFEDINEYVPEDWKSKCWFGYFGKGLVLIRFNAFRPKTGIKFMAVGLDDDRVLKDCVEEEKWYRCWCGGKEGGFWVELPYEEMDCIDKAIAKHYGIKPK